MATEEVTKLHRQYCQRFGQIAVELGFVTVDQLIRALEEQVRDDVDGRPHRLLGTIFFEHSQMTPAQIDAVLNRLFELQRDGGS